MLLYHLSLTHFNILCKSTNKYETDKTCFHFIDKKDSAYDREVDGDAINFDLNISFYPIATLASSYKYPPKYIYQYTAHTPSVKN